MKSVGKEKQRRQSAASAKSACDYDTKQKIPQKFGGFTENPYICTELKKIGGFMEILNKEFWEKRDAAMKRFMASKERKRKRMAELEQMLRQDYLARTGEEPKFVNVW